MKNKPIEQKATEHSKLVKLANLLYKKLQIDCFDEEGYADDEKLKTLLDCVKKSGL